MTFNETLWKKMSANQHFYSDYKKDKKRKRFLCQSSGKQYWPMCIVSLILPEVWIPRDQYLATASLFFCVTYYCWWNARRAPQLEPGSRRGQPIAWTYDTVCAAFIIFCVSPPMVERWFLLYLLRLWKQCASGGLIHVCIEECTSTPLPLTHVLHSFSCLFCSASPHTDIQYSSLTASSEDWASLRISSTHTEPAWFKRKLHKLCFTQTRHLVGDNVNVSM